jgi:NTP pyrophosphatase (non-canonical NTP hydrolase)
MKKKNLNEWAQEVWQNAEDHGFHAPGVNNEPPSWCANLHGEVSELWEAYRAGKLNVLCDKPIQLTCMEEELADIVIRVLDVARQKNIDMDRAVHLKHEYNQLRPYLHGGKKA